MVGSGTGAGESVQHGRKGGGILPPVGSTDESSDQAITLADLTGDDEPEIPLAVVGAGGIQNAITLQIDHDGMDGALVAAGIHAHAPNDVGAGLGTVLNQGGADGGAGESGEVHRSGVVN